MSRPSGKTLLLLFAWSVLSVLSAIVLLNVQSQNTEGVKHRFQDRTAVSAAFAATYARALLNQERRVARRELSGATVSGGDLARVGNLYDYEAAVVLDARSRVIQITPAKPSLIGQPLAARYPHLRSATEGRAAISAVVPSAAEGIPVVAFATPFETPSGRRVFSGAFDVQTTPIGAYLRHATALAGAHIYLIDPAGKLVATNRRGAGRFPALAQADPELARALKRSLADATRDGYQYSSEPVAGTPWRLVMAVPEDVLFEQVSGFSRYVPWLLWIGFVLGGLASALLVSNLIASRVNLRIANEDLDRLSRMDDLTGLYNRRQVQACLDAALANDDRYSTSLSLLMIDVDWFKDVNDAYGHEAGDAVLRFVSERLKESLRAGDIVGRWGGEEFLAILPSTSLSAAEAVAERLREAVAFTPIIVQEQLIPVSVSIGLAARAVDQDCDALVAEADAAMYAAKAAGRDRVHTAVPAT